MPPEAGFLWGETRRHFFSRCGVGLGQIALASLFGNGKLPGATAQAVNPMAPKAPHFPAKVKNIIYLFMAGGPSQLEMFDYKPKLKEFDGKVTPDELIKGKRFAFMDTFTKNPPRLLASHREFQQDGRAGIYLSAPAPHLPPATRHDTG